MKIAIENFSTTADTQCLYLSDAFNSLGHESIIFDQTKNSIYDIFDSYRPDIFIAHAFRLSNDVLHYIENNSCDLDILLNVSQIPTNTIINFDQLFDEKNITSSFFFTSSDSKDLPKRKRNILSLRHAADTNLLKMNPSIIYSIDKAIFLYDKIDVKDYGETYHTIANDPHLNDIVDIYLPEMSLAPLYKFYNEIIFTDFKGFFPQAFFDAIAMGTKVYFDIIETRKIEELNGALNKLFKEDVNLIYSDKNKLSNFTQLYNSVLEKHSPINRAKSILSNIKSGVTI